MLLRDLQSDHQTARGLAAQGLFAQAVEIAEASNDTSLQIDLVGWRHEAFYQGARSPGRASWPPAYKDLFPRSGIPEISRRDLTDDMIGGAILHHGALVVRDVLAKGEAERFKRGIDDAFAARADGRMGADYSEFNSVRAPDFGISRAFAGEIGIMAVDAPRMLSEWSAYLRTSGIVDIVSSYLGERPVLSATKTALLRIPPDHRSEWHQDGAFLGEGVRVVNLWVALTDCGIDAPSLELVPWRLDEIVVTGKEGAVFDWSVGPRTAEGVIAGRPTERLVFKAGDAVMFDQMNLHRTSVSATMTKQRHAIETWLFAPGGLAPEAPIVL